MFTSIINNNDVFDLHAMALELNFLNNSTKKFEIIKKFKISKTSKTSKKSEKETYHKIGNTNSCIDHTDIIQHFA